MLEFHDVVVSLVILNFENCKESRFQFTIECQLFLSPFYFTSLYPQNIKMPLRLNMR
jgi:hypothetical protein